MELQHPLKIKDVATTEDPRFRALLQALEYTGFQVLQQLDQQDVGHIQELLSTLDPKFQSTFSVNATNSGQKTLERVRGNANIWTWLRDNKCDFEEWIKEVNNFRQDFHKMDTPAQDVNMVDTWQNDPYNIWINKGRLTPSRTTVQSGANNLLRIATEVELVSLCGWTSTVGSTMYCRFNNNFFCTNSLVQQPSTNLRGRVKIQLVYTSTLWSRPWALQRSSPTDQSACTQQVVIFQKKQKYIHTQAIWKKTGKTTLVSQNPQPLRFFKVLTTCTLPKVRKNPEKKQQKIGVLNLVVILQGDHYICTCILDEFFSGQHKPQKTSKNKKSRYIFCGVTYMYYIYVDFVHPVIPVIIIDVSGAPHCC